MELQIINKMLMDHYIWNLMDNQVHLQDIDEYNIFFELIQDHYLLNKYFCF